MTGGVTTKTMVSVSGYTLAMKFLAKNRKLLFAGTIVILALSLIAVWLGNGVASGYVIQPVAQKTPDVTSPQTSQTKTLAPALVSGINNPQPNTNAAKTTLPPIPAEMAAEIRRLSSRSHAGLVEKKHADGSVSVDLQGRFQSVTVAVRGPDGKIIIRHGEDFLGNIQPDSNASHP